MLTGPLHRLTPLRDDPVAGWTSGPGRLRADLVGAAIRALLGLLLLAAWFAVALLPFIFAGVPLKEAASLLRNPGLVLRALIVPVVLGGVLLAPTRRVVLARRSRALGEDARATAAGIALALDDLSRFDEEPDGRVMSLVGWVRGRGHVAPLVGGDRAVGFALRCQEKYPFVFETMHAFELVDDAGRSVLVVPTQGRLLGEPNLRLDRGKHDDRVLLSQFDLPARLLPTDWNALVVRDGDPVTVIGAKTTVHVDDEEGRPATARAALASAPSRPLLVIPLDAERRDVFGSVATATRTLADGDESA